MINAPTDGEAIMLYRRRSDKRQVDLGHDYRVHETTVSLWELGEEAPPERLVKTARDELNFHPVQTYENVLLVRIRRGLGQKQLARAMGVSRQTVVNRELGKRDASPTLHWMLKEGWLNDDPE